MAQFSESFELSWSDSFYGFADLPSDVLLLILRYLPLPDLANTRLVCSRLLKLVDADYSSHLWANAALEGSCQWINEENRGIIQRAADIGNVEALIILAVAYLYREGVADGPGKGTLDDYNGLKATECLIQAERLSPHTPPFSWVLFRPPWASNSLCCKTCVCNQMKIFCNENTEEVATGIHYSIGKALTFHDPSDSVSDADINHWFELGANKHCPYSALEVWRRRYKPNIYMDKFESIRELRKAACAGTNGHHTYNTEARFELCQTYAQGFYGGVTRSQALQFIRQTVELSKPVLYAHKSVQQHSRYILIDWIIEVATMKSFSALTVHVAINLIDRYFLRHKLPHSKLQLLGVTALLIAARWTGNLIITIREASWLTENTYDYEEVVRMMGELLATFKGDVRHQTIFDYLEIMLPLIGANTTTKYMAYYLSECVLLHQVFSRCSAAHLAAACLLEARILLGQEYPWPMHMVEATGLTVTDLQMCCLAIYNHCLTDRYAVTDYRHMKLQAVFNRYSTDEFCSVSHINLMSFQELKEQLGVDPDSSYHQVFSPSPQKPAPFNGKKVLSFVSDSWYLSSPSNETDTSHHQTDHSPELVSNDVEDPSPVTQYILSGAAIDDSLSGFPQPLFDDDSEDELPGPSLPLCQEPPSMGFSTYSNGVYASSSDEGDQMTESSQRSQEVLSLPDKVLKCTAAIACSTPKVSQLSQSVSCSKLEVNNEATCSNYPLETDQVVLPTPLDKYNLLDQGPENTTPVDPSVINAQSLAIKQQLKLSSCSPKCNHFSRNRPPLKPVNYMGSQLLTSAAFQYVAVDSKENVCVKGRARKFVKRHTAETRKPVKKSTS